MIIWLDTEMFVVKIVMAKSFILEAIKIDKDGIYIKKALVWQNAIVLLQIAILESEIKCLSKLLLL